MAAAVDYAKKYGLLLSKKGYEDLGLSGFRGKNRGEGSDLHALINAIRAGKIPSGSVLLIENLDRLSRDFVIDAIELFLSIIRAGVTIVSLMDKMVYNRETLRGNTGQLNYSITVLQRGHEESMTKSIRISQEWGNAQANAGTTKITQSYPSWLELKDNKFTVRPQQAAIVQDIFKQFLAGKGPGAIARDLNTRKILTFKGKSWYQTTVKFYLRFHAVIGEYNPGHRDGPRKVKSEKVFSDYYPAIISVSDFNRAQAKFALNPSKKGRPQKEDANLFSGLITCAYCGDTMGIYNAAKSQAYVCWRGVAGACIRVAYPREDIEGTILGTLEECMKDWANSKTDTKRIEELMGEIAMTQTKIKNYNKVIEAGAGLDSVIIALKELQKTKETLTKELAKEKAITATATSPGVFQKWMLETELEGKTEERLAIIPHIRNHVRSVKVWTVGDQFDAYQDRLKHYAKKGQNGSQCYHAIRKELKTQYRRYHTCELTQPINVDGKPTTELKFGMVGFFYQHDPQGGLKTFDYRKAYNLGPAP